MAYDLKPFVINLEDLVYLLQQVNFVPLFDGPANSNGLVAFTGTVDAYSANGTLLWDMSLNSGAGGLTVAAGVLGYTSLADLGTGFPQVSAPVGVRDVSGLHNNLFGTQADWGSVDVPFRRDIAADFNNYITSNKADLAVSFDSLTSTVTVRDLPTSTDTTFDFSTAVADALTTAGALATDVLSVAMNAAATEITIKYTTTSGIPSSVISMADVSAYAAAVVDKNTITENAAHITTTAHHNTDNSATVVIDYNTTVDVNGVHQGNVTDSSIRMISRTITTAGVNLLQDTAGVLGDPGALIEWDSARYISDTDLCWPD